MSNVLKEVRFTHDFYGALNELQVALCIDGKDYAERDPSRLLSNVKERLQKQYALDTTVSIDELYSASIMGDEVSNFLESTKYMYDKLCGLSHFFRFTGKIPINLSDVNYLGTTKNQMLSLLKLLQTEGRQEFLSSTIENIKSRMLSIPQSVEKQMFMCLVISYNLKLFELTAVLAEILYMGGI